LDLRSQKIKNFTIAKPDDNYFRTEDFVVQSSKD